MRKFTHYLLYLLFLILGSEIDYQNKYLELLQKVEDVINITMILKIGMSCMLFVSLRK